MQEWGECSQQQGLTFKWGLVHWCTKVVVETQDRISFTIISVFLWKWEFFAPALIPNNPYSKEQIAVSKYLQGGKFD